MNFAIKRGCESYLDSGDYNFYYNLFLPQNDLDIDSANKYYSNTENSHLLSSCSSKQLRENYPEHSMQVNDKSPDQMLDFYTELQETIEALHQV